MSSKSQNVLDVAIVGGGVSGIYSGWRLATAGPRATKAFRRSASPDVKLSIGVFEGSDRIGGRLLSAQSPNAPDTICEIGGMRYVSSQTIIRSLVENELKLPKHEQVVDLPGNIAFLRGRSLRNSQTTDPSALPYNLTWGEQQFLQKPGKTANALIGWGVGNLLPGVLTLTGDALLKYLQDAVFDGAPLYKHGFWNLLARSISTEALSLSKAMVGYDSLAANTNAVDLTSEYFDFTPGVKYYLLDNGYDAVPWTLQERFEKAGGAVTKGAWLEGFDATTLPDKTKGVELRFRDGRAPVLARSIVLAMPRRSIELLAPRGPVLDPEKAPVFHALLNSVEPIPLYKLFLVYPFPWWTATGVSQGRSLTDLPLHQCYYWPNGPKGTTKADGPGIIMAYNDMTGVEFWGGLSASGKPSRIPGAPQVHRLFQRHGGTAKGSKTDHRLRKNWSEREAPHAMVVEMHRQLMLMHGVSYAPDPIDAAFMDWSDDPYGGGVHFWNIGYKSWEILETMTKPVPDFPCFVCGEAWSTNQTWVEGALQTAEIMLQKHFGLLAPGWITCNPI